MRQPCTLPASILIDLDQACPQMPWPFGHAAADLSLHTSSRSAWCRDALFKFCWSAVQLARLASRQACKLCVCAGRDSELTTDAARALAAEGRAAMESASFPTCSVRLHTKEFGAYNGAKLLMATIDEGVLEVCSRTHLNSCLHPHRLLIFVPFACRWGLPHVACS